MRRMKIRLTYESGFDTIHGHWVLVTFGNSERGLRGSRFIFGTTGLAFSLGVEQLGSPQGFRL